MPKKIVIYMIKGDLNGPRTIEIGNWSGKAIYSKKNDLADVLSREEYDGPGVYILRSDTESELFEEKIYIGETECLRERLKNHIQNDTIEFIDSICFLSKDKQFTKAHVGFIESILIKQGLERNISEITNEVIPQKNQLPEFEVSDMLYYIEQIELILSISNYKFLNNNVEKKDDLQRFYINNSYYNSTMIITEYGFLVEKGSTACKNPAPSLGKNYSKKRDSLIKKGILIEQNNLYVFTEDYIFDSPTAAAQIIIGYTVSGPQKWLTENKISYRDYIKNKI